MVDWMIKVVSKLLGDYDPLILFKSVQMLDFYIHSRGMFGQPLHKDSLHAVGAACLMIAGDMYAKSEKLSLSNIYDDACHGSI